jgi:hypothetical protein
MQVKEPEMTAQDVIAFVQLLNQHHIDVYIDGGWGVDALLGEQMRAPRRFGHRRGAQGCATDPRVA